MSSAAPCSSSSSSEVAIVAIIQAAPGKLERLRAVCSTAISWIHANEPDTLEFSLYEEDQATSADDGGSDSSNSGDGGGGGGVRLFMHERYTSQAALARHESSDNYREFFRKLTEEGLLAGTPIIVRGGGGEGFRR